MRTTTSFIHVVALALAAASMLATPATASAETYTTKPAVGIKLPSAVMAVKRTVEVRGVSQPNLKPNICNTRPEKFKGCQVF